ncbi:MAG: TolC family protein [Gemmataceae bacterium]
MGDFGKKLVDGAILCAGLAAVFGVVPWTGAQTPVMVETAPSPCRFLTLPESISLALENQPNLRARRASLESAKAGCQGLARLKIPTLLRPDLPYRRQQADWGVRIAQAALCQEEAHTTYAVTRAYLTVLYTRELERMARDSIRDQQLLHSAVQHMVDSAVYRHVSERDIAKAQSYLELTESRLPQAQVSVQRAIGAWREAIGLGPDCCLEPFGDRLSALDVPVNCQQIVALALARRGELIQANAAVQIFHLEVQAQAATRGKRASTFAAGADLHAEPLPAGNGSQLAPRVLGVEMPTMLAGDRHARVARAKALSVRAEAVADKTLQLITLEAQDAYWQWRQHDEEIARLQKALTSAAAVSSQTEKDFKIRGSRVTFDEVILTKLLTIQTRRAMVDSRYQLLLVLAALERVTAGGFHAGICSALDAPADDPDRPRPADLNGFELTPEASLGLDSEAGNE